MADELSKLIEKRSNKNKKKSNQIPYAIGLIVIICILSIRLFNIKYTYAMTLIIGTIMGIILRYSRFCFVGSIRDPLITGNTKIIRAVILAMMVSTIGFSIIQSNYLKTNPINYLLIPGTVNKVGIHIMIGAFMFGVGMIMAGTCASGLLMRMGEGHMLQWIVLLGFIIGTLLGAKDYHFWYENIISKAKTIYFPEYLNMKIVVALQMIFLIILYRVALMYENNKKLK